MKYKTPESRELAYKKEIFRQRITMAGVISVILVIAYILFFIF